MLAYLFMSFEMLMKFITNKNLLIYIYLINISQANLKIDRYDYAKKIFLLAYKKFEKCDYRNIRNSLTTILLLYYQT